MKGFCISLDVSKGTSFYQGFKGIDEPITKPKKIEHNLKGFKELQNLKEKIRKEYNEECIVIFESTGVYHKALQIYLDEHKFQYIIISPLLSAKVRKSDIRGTKTDTKDCASIAKVFYLKELRIYSKTDEMYDDLKDKSRYYDFLVDEMKRWKIEFRRILDIIYPGFDKVFNNLYTDYVQEILLEYPHPEIIKHKRLDTIAKFIEKHTCHKEAFCLKQANVLKEYAENCASGCSKNSYLVNQFSNVIHTLNSQIKHLDYVLDEIMAVKDACGPRTLKVILETCYLTDEEIVRASKICKEAGADFVKTSTGFGIGGATEKAVKLMRETVGKDMGVKASGGVRTKADMDKMIKAGANRIGASAGVKIMEEYNNE